MHRIHSMFNQGSAMMKRFEDDYVDAKTSIFITRPILVMTHEEDIRSFIFFGCFSSVPKRW